MLEVKKMSHVDLLNRFDDISLDFFNGEIGLLETLDALDDLSEDCEQYLTNIDNVEVQSLATLLIDIADFEESLLDACTLVLEDEVGGDLEVIEVPAEYIDDSANAEDDYISYEDMVEQINEVTPEVSESNDNFASSKEYEQMRKEWLNKRQNERQSAIKNEKEIPLEERYKAAMTAFKELQADKSQAWKLDDEGSWLAEDLERWGKEAMEWKDIFSKYYTKLAKEIYKKADKIEADYEAPITEEDINIEDQIDDSELTEEEVADVEERADETEEESNETAPEQEQAPEQATEETAKEEQPAEEQKTEQQEETATESKEADSNSESEQQEKAE